MIESIRELQSKVKDLRKEISRIKSKQITHKNIKESTKSIVDFYFRNIREVLIDKKIQNDTLKSTDYLMQNLLEATHKSSSITIYSNAMKNLQKILIQLEHAVLLNPDFRSKTEYNDPTDNVIISTLDQMIPSAAVSYKQALLDLQSNDRFSWRGPATDLREALRECFDHLAPDKEVMDQEGFKLEFNTNGPTMKQKVKFILKQRDCSKNKIKPAEDSITIIEETLGSFVRSVYSRASISTHTPTDKSEVKRIYDLVKLVLCEILEIS